jgi:hypothetical protein
MHPPLLHYASRLNRIEVQFAARTAIRRRVRCKT